MSKKKSRASRKKNRKGAAGKASSAVCGDHKYEVSVYLRHLQNKVNLTERERKLLRMYEYAEASNMSEVVLFKDEKSLVEAREEIHSWNEADNLYFKDPRMWLFTIHDMREDEQIFDKVFQGPVLHKWLKQTQKRLETMVKSAITSERIHGVVIEGLVLHVAKVFMMDLQEKKSETADESTTIKSYYCSKECQIGDWKDHKADCNKFQKDDYKIVKKFTRNFFIKHQYLITERVKAASLEYSLETVEMVMCLDFRGSENGAPALQNLPNFCFLPKKCFLNRIEEQHSDLYNADNIKRFIDSMISKLGNNFVIVSVSSYSKHCIGVVHFQSNTYGEIWFLNREIMGRDQSSIFILGIFVLYRGLWHIPWRIYFHTLSLSSSQS
ncbi:predicted protein [Chaetoceros tenuissimus]|uniref:MYND-type domain-containing protein n=1 Tax=Chaetoceros tenuissimus TaxID=426638 RepID=A0AAD3H9H3_9STRA|nr:predicted protein [Chaetoceros tenuissimus]